MLTWAVGPSIHVSGTTKFEHVHRGSTRRVDPVGPRFSATPARYPAADVTNRDRLAQHGVTAVIRTIRTNSTDRQHSPTALTTTLTTTEVDMYAPERQQAILGLARADGRVDVNGLADRFEVTPETIRRDLTEPGTSRRTEPGARRRHPGRAADHGTGRRRTVRSQCRPEGSDRQGGAGSTAGRRLDHHRRRHHHRPVRRHPARGPRPHRGHPRTADRRPAGRASQHHSAPGRRPGTPRHAGRGRQLGRTRATQRFSPTSPSPVPTASAGTGD